MSSGASRRPTSISTRPIALGVAIDRAVILEDSEIGATGALASGATVIGFAGGAHCFDGHADMLRGLGVEHIAHSFDEVGAADRPVRREWPLFLRLVAR